MLRVCCGHPTWCELAMLEYMAARGHVAVLLRGEEAAGILDSVTFNFFFHQEDHVISVLQLLVCMGFGLLESFAAWVPIS